jgi:hypothetical protein
MRSEPRWLDTEAAAEYISVRPDALQRLVRAGRVPSPSYHLGPRNPRWDRLELDSRFQGRAASTNIEQAVQALAEKILKRA